MAIRSNMQIKIKVNRLLVSNTRLFSLPNHTQVYRAIAFLFLKKITITDVTDITSARIFLGGAPLLSTFYMLMSIKAARQRDIPSHTDYAMRCFLYSIEGGGTIRQGWNLSVGELGQKKLGYGMLVHCQMIHSCFIVSRHFTHTTTPC